jgi:seryl-tRNA synthetase
MHDIKAIRETPDHYVTGWRRRDSALNPVPEIMALDEKLRAAQTTRMVAEAERNAASKAIGAAKAQKNEAEAARLMDVVAVAKATIEGAAETEGEVGAALFDLLAALPNIPAADVPDGPDETANKLARIHGEPTALAFDPRDHVDLGEGLGMVDFEAAARISGARFVATKGQIARLHRALGQFMLDMHTAPESNGLGGYLEVDPPVLVRSEALFGTGQLPKFADDLFHTADDRWLIPTAEVSLTNLVREQILPEEELPLRFSALTPCFRAEAGSAGRDTRGMIRQHQFWKVELVSITSPEASNAEHERMTGCAEEVLKRLSLPYRVMMLCTGDMGFGAQKTFDIDVWLPAQNTYREISSCSNCGDFQARRMNTRFRAKGEKNTRFVHTLNGSGLAVGRTLVAVMENYQQGNGTISVPDVLQPYMGGLEVIGA